MKKQYKLTDEEVFRTFFHPGEVVEVRILGQSGMSDLWSGFSKGTLSGYYDEFEPFRRMVIQADKWSHHGIYFTLQVIDPRLLGRAYNRLIAADTTTSDNDVIAYRYLPIDTDPVRPAGVSASDTELMQALKVRDEVADWIMSRFDFPPPIRAMSGNGGHLLFRLPDLPNTTENQEFIKSILTQTAVTFDDEKVKIDTVVANPSRIWKLYGTTARKGDELPANKYREARPHRMSYIDYLGGYDG
jgi:hypothetical protein